MRRRPSVMNLENVTAVMTDAVGVLRSTRRMRAHVVWVHTFGFPTLAALRALALAAAARLGGGQAVVHFHAFGLEQFVAEAGVPLRLVVRALAAITSSLVVVHEQAAEAIRSITRGGEVHVLHNWVDVPDQPAPLPPPQPLRVVFVGGLVRRKGAPQLIEAMRALANEPIQLRMVGGPGEDGPEALEALKTGAADLVSADRVAFAGERDPAGVRAELRTAHLFVLPSQAEGTPIAMLEAMAEGRPVLVTDAGNMRSLVEETGSGWVLPDRQPATIAAHILRLAGEGDLHSVVAAGARARQAAVKLFSPPAARGVIEGVLFPSSRPSSHPPGRSMTTG